MGIKPSEITREYIAGILCAMQVAGDDEASAAIEKFIVQLEADVMRLRAIADDEADRIVALESGISALAERAERVQEGEEWDLPEFILRKRDALLKETP